MKKSHLTLILIFIAASLLISACTGGAGAASSWPGLTIDMEREQAYVAFGPQVYAVNLGNGTEKWRAPVEPDNQVTFFAVPALTDDGQLVAASYDGNLYSINPENGQLNWVFEDGGNRFVAGPLADGEQIFAPSTDNSLYTLTTAGDLVWSFETDDILWSTPVTDGETVYQPGMDHRVYALDAESGELIWKTDKLGGSIAGTPALSPDGLLYVGTFGNELLALDTNRSGEIVWRMPASAWVYSGPTQDGDTLYVGDLDGAFYAVEGPTGGIKWRIQPDPEDKRAITDNPLVLGDTVYFTSESGALFAVERENGDPKWSKQIDGRLYAGPKSAGETIIIAPIDTDELLIALDENGNQKWVFVPEN